MAKQFTFAHGSHADYIEALYQQYKKNPLTIDSSWRIFFEGYEFALNTAPPTTQKSSSPNDPQSDRRNHAKIEALINVYRRIGHLYADLNPLKQQAHQITDLDLKKHGLDQLDPKKKVLPTNFGDKAKPFAHILDQLKQTYQQHIGADFRELNNIEMVTWLQKKMEDCQNKPPLSVEEKKRILNKLCEAEGFEHFLQARYLGQKRFSLEGLDSLIPLLDTVINEASVCGVKKICMGMAHRGRLNVLANIMKKPYDLILQEFEGRQSTQFDIEGDVKYHLGYANTLTTQDKHQINLYLLPNPSHLEAVNPVVEGYTRYQQEQLNNHQDVLPILLHGDAAFAGQGIVAETLNLSQLKGYHTGGTIHVITNNLIGFTTNPEDQKSCSYSSDISKIVRAPVLHVNADNPEAVNWVATLAIMFRKKFKQDIVIDLIGYRRYGHNETDEPGFTQPKLYKKIKKHPTVLTLYSQKLVHERVITEKELQTLKQTTKHHLQAAYEKNRKKTTTRILTKTPETLTEFFFYEKAERKDLLTKTNTSCPKKKLLDLGKKITDFPSNFTPHPKIKRLFQMRKEMLKGQGQIDWAFAELLAFASLAQENHHIRLSGQDVQRGTFSSRHALLIDYESNDTYNPFEHISPKAKVNFINSPLSEQACLGFEFGYSILAKKTLVLWEAQFGDFANGAQIIIDQFLVSSEAKWQQTSHLVLLLPHGHEGMGPEHSSARPERFLQCAGSLNIQVCNLTTPAQYFHALRRQVLRKHRKPLILMSPKSALRHPRVMSTLDEFTTMNFEEILTDPIQTTVSKTHCMILCTGKIYFDLLEKKESNLKLKNIMLVRCEQLYPFPKEKITHLFKQYKHLNEIKWVQEEPKNMGAWNYILPRLQAICPNNVTLRYIGRKHSGSTAEGSATSHKIEQDRIIKDAFS